MYQSHGAMVQTWTEPPPCETPPTCNDWDTGAPVCCTGSCAVLALASTAQMQVLNPNDPATGGVRLVYAPMPTK